MLDKPTRVLQLNRRIARFEQRLAILNKRSDTFSWLRLGIFLGGLAVSLIAFFAVGIVLAAGLFLATVVAFIVAVYLQRKINDSILRHEVWIKLKIQQVARIELDWTKIPRPPFLLLLPKHPFGIDLDLIGERSVTHLLNTAVSFEGSLRLQEWLLAPTPTPTISLTHQTLVRELVPLARFRDKLSLNALLAERKGNQQSVLLQWLGQQDEISAAALHPMLILFTALVVLNAALWFGNLIGIFPPLYQLSVPIYLALYVWKVQRLGDVFETTAVIADELDRLRAVFQQLENYPYRAAKNPALKQLIAPFRDSADRPSAKLRRLNWIMSAASVRGNGLLWFLLNTLVPWDLYVAYLFKRIKVDMAALLPRWLDIWFELEAVGSLANFAYLNPEYAFPELLPDGTTLRGQALGHPQHRNPWRSRHPYRVEYVRQKLISADAWREPVPGLRGRSCQCNRAHRLAVQGVYLYQSQRLGDGWHLLLLC